MILIVISRDNIQEGPPLHQVSSHDVPIVEEAIVQPSVQADQRTALWISTRIRKSIIRPDYMVYLNDIDEKDDDPKMFLQAMNGDDLLNWLDAMKKKLSPMDKNYLRINWPIWRGVTNRVQVDLSNQKET